MKLPKHLIVVNILIAGMVGSFGSTVLAIDDRVDLVEFDARHFSRPTIIDNKWMPLKPGMQLVYEGSAVEDGKKIAHRVIWTITDLVKVINGIETVVVWDRDFSDGRLEESELVYRAQDDDGNVWHMGELFEFYDDKGFVGAKVWLAGHLGAKAGIIMEGKPGEGMPSYSQGFSDAPYNWSDRGQVRKVGEKVTVPAGTFEDVVITEEWSKEEPAAVQLKYNAPGIGTIKIAWEGNDPTKEGLELTKILQLNAREMDRVRSEALKLEERAYVYSRTDPARRRQSATRMAR